MSTINVNNLTVKYGSRIAVDNVTFEIPDGCVGLLGPNGAGKTTLIKCLLGFVPPASGTGKVLGLDIATSGLAIRQKVGLMPELDCHIPGINAVTYVAYTGELAGMPASLAIGRAHEVLEYCGLGEARYRQVETYSTGMLQRIKLAQALVHGPGLLLLDEPTNGLDPRGREEMLALIKDISHGKGVSVIVSSHLMPDIERVCDYAIVMRGGKVATSGDIDSLRSVGGYHVEVELREPCPAFARAMEARGARILQDVGSILHIDMQNVQGRQSTVLFQAAAESDTQLRGFRPVQRSMEDVFLAAIDQENAA